MSAFAQIERDFIKQRQTEGIATAKARGVKFGRPTISLPDNFDNVQQQWLRGELSARKAAKILGVSHVTFINWARKNS